MTIHCRVCSVTWCNDSEVNNVCWCCDGMIGVNPSAPQIGTWPFDRNALLYVRPEPDVNPLGFTPMGMGGLLG